MTDDPILEQLEARAEEARADEQRHAADAAAARERRVRYEKAAAALRAAPPVAKKKAAKKATRPGRASPGLAEKQARILTAFRDAGRPLTRRELCEATGIYTSAVGAAIQALLEADEVRPLGERQGKMGVPAMTYGLMEHTYNGNGAAHAS